MAEARVGTSGWSYAGWQGAFYPRQLRAGERLAFLARHLRTVELNATFYRLQPVERFATWVAATPASFRFAVKAWRAVTHFRRLAACEDLLRTFFDRLEPLGAKCGPILLQLPPRFAADPPRLDAFLAALPADHRYALEFRDPSWWADAVLRILHHHRAAFCVFELGALRSPRLVTTDLVYLRLHGRERRYRGAYGEPALRGWAAWLAGELVLGHDVWAYLDNTDEADDALRDALCLQALLDAAAP